MQKLKPEERLKKPEKELKKLKDVQRKKQEERLKKQEKELKKKKDVQLQLLKVLGWLPNLKVALIYIMSLAGGQALPQFPN